MNVKSCGAVVLVSLGLLTVSACAARSSPAPEKAGAGAPAEPPAAPATAATVRADETLSDDGRKIVSEATLSLKTSHPESEADAVGHYAADIGGYVAHREAARSDDIVRNVELTLRVPASKFEAALGELRRHGNVLSESVSGQDVTEDFTDTEAQLKSKRRLEERLLHIVEGSSSVKDMLEVETELTRVRTDIERLEGHSRFLANRVAFATIRATFVSPMQPGADDGESLASRFANAFREAGSLFTHVTVGIIVALGAVLPVAAPAAAAFLVVRRRRRFREARASE